MWICEKESDECVLARYSKILKLLVLRRFNPKPMNIPKLNDGILWEIWINIISYKTKFCWESAQRNIEK